jgi:hypothetical protein
MRCIWEKGSRAHEVHLGEGFKGEEGQVERKKKKDVL